MGYSPAPPRGAVPLLPADVAPRLAYYASQSLGVLAPRGWRCFEVYGSNGSFLYVTPQAIGYREIGPDASQLAGPVVQVGVNYGGTSGRFAVAEAIARLFPDHIAFIRQVEETGLEFAEPLPAGPYPNDRLDRRSATEVRFVTPARREGLGTERWIAPGGSAVRGFVILLPEQDMDLVAARVRLPAGQDDLAPAILDEAALSRGQPR